jgi:hypothetical protein
MTTLSEESTTASSQHSRLVRQRLAERCIATLHKLLPQPDSRARGVWNETAIRELTAILELQRVELHSEQEEQRIDNYLIADVIDCLTTKSYFPDPRAPSLVIDMEIHLRVLAEALRIYKYHGKSLNQQLHESVYQGISKLWSDFQNARGRRNETLRVEDWNVSFLVNHCQGLLVSVDSSDSFSRKISKRAIVFFDTAVSGASGQYQDLRPGLVQLLKRQRDRPKWHEEFVRLEDACSGVFAGEIRFHGTYDISALVDEAIAATIVLEESMEFHCQGRRQGPGVTDRVRKVMGIATEAVSDSGAYEEHGEYLRYGILDLLSLLLVRTRKRSRVDCFQGVLRIVRMVLERSPKSANMLHLKATDLWNRILDLGVKDEETYGDPEDRYAILDWVRQNPTNVEAPENSATYTFKC